MEQTGFDVRTRFTRSSTARAIMLALVPALCLTSFAICVLPQIGVVPAWVVFVVNVALTIRIVALHHELIHESKANVDWNPLIMLNLHIYTPFTVGFAELRKLHLLHHQHTNTDGDPDYPMVKGGRLRSVLGLAFMPEYWFFYALKHRLVSSNFWRLLAVRSVVLAVFVYVVGVEVYLVLYLLPSKIANAVLYMLFSYDVHTDDDGERRGNHNFLPMWSAPGTLARWFIGRVAYNGSYHHATHHRYPWVRGDRLHNATAYFQQKEWFSVRRRLV